MANFGPSKTWTDGEILSHTDLNAALLDIINNVTNNNIDADNIDETDDYTWSGANSFTGGHSITVLSNAAASIVTGTTLEWNPGDGGQMTDNSSGISLDFKLPDAADNQDTFASIAAICLDDTSTSEDGELSFRVATAGTNTEQMTLSSTALTVTPAITASGGITSGGNIVSDTDSTDDLGTTGVRWANLFVDDVTVTNNVTIGGTLTLTGGITLNGNTTIGDSSADTLTVNSTITSNLIFTDATYDIGASGATRPRDLFLSRNAVMGGTLGVTGATTLSSTLGVTGLITASGGVSGALTGNVTGNVTGNLTGDVTGNISGNVTGGTISGTTGTFSGDLTVDTNIFKVDSVNNSVGFGLTNPSDYAFNGTPSWVASGGASNASVILVSGTTSTGYLAFADGTTGTDRYSGNIQYNHSTNTMSFRTNGGVEAMTINSAQDLAVDTDTLFVDASADRVGINTASPDSALHIDGTGGASNTTSQLRFSLDGTTEGIFGVASSTNNIISGSAQGDTVIRNDGGSIRFSVDSGSSTAATLDSSGNMGLGVTPSGYFADKLVVSAGNADGITIAASATSDVNYFLFADGTSGNAAYRGQILYDHGNDKMQFATAATAALTIDSSQRVGISTSSPDSQNVLTLQDDSNGYVGIRFNGTGSYAHNWSLYGSGDGAGNEFFGLYDATNGAYRVKVDESGNVLIGYASSNGSYKLQVNSQIFATNATIATSDGRYKEDVQTLSNATDLVTRLNPVQFRWKAHETHNFDVGKTDVGFIAQEVQEVLSDTDYSDSVVVINKTDDEEYLGLGETKLIPLLTAALQEAITKIETLETKVAALEAA